MFRTAGKTKNKPNVFEEEMSKRKKYLSRSDNLKMRGELYEEIERRNIEDEGSFYFFILEIVEETRLIRYFKPIYTRRPYLGNLLQPILAHLFNFMTISEIIEASKISRRLRNVVKQKVLIFNKFKELKNKSKSYTVQTELFYENSTSIEYIENKLIGIAFSYVDRTYLVNYLIFAILKANNHFELKFTIDPKILKIIENNLINRKCYISNFEISSFHPDTIKIKTVANIIKNNTSFKNLTIKNLDLSTFLYLEVFRGLENNKSIKELNLLDCTINETSYNFFGGKPDDNLTKIFNSVLKNKSIEKFSINNLIHDQPLKLGPCLLNFIMNNRYVKCLHLISCKPFLSLESLDSLRLSSVIEVLEISNCGINNELLGRLANVLEINTSIKTLILKNMILNHKECVNSISKIIERNLNIKELDLSNNSIDKNFIRKLKVVLENNTTLKKLDLSFNILDDNALFEIYDILRFNFDIESINIFNNPIKSMEDAITDFSGRKNVIINHD